MIEFSLAENQPYACTYLRGFMFFNIIINNNNNNNRDKLLVIVARTAINNIASCAIWLRNMDSYIKGGIQAKGI